MHLGDSIFIFILALVLFGPKKLPEMARQIGKLMAEFRRASNDFRMQIDEELRTMERQEQLEAQRKKQEAEQASLAAASSLPTSAAQLTAGSPDEASFDVLAASPGEGVDSAETIGAGSLQILPPAVGEQVSAGSPYAVSAPSASASVPDHPEDHPLLRVDSIPVDPQAGPNQPIGLAAAEANAAQLHRNGAVGAESTGDSTHLEAEETPMHHG